ncbi:hypothetical protein Marme_2469 [Marinomonas mediterranea MMB-1]|jgi:hypothetical protein|uniref:Uncharacterized protein n=1 Tax=Marinomonas mediterranea (strain ATCC 700492 / JCM 21426 / NBRC 103028 / MMB-1) TaxID=717774 RepID=F2JVR5_MARM1|nr:hypothetical protein Marme_2469 [Marinomonas mediterranea MMB-1]
MKRERKTPAGTLAFVYSVMSTLVRSLYTLKVNRDAFVEA